MAAVSISESCIQTTLSIAEFQAIALGNDDLRFKICLARNPYCDVSEFFSRRWKTHLQTAPVETIIFWRNSQFKWRLLSCNFLQSKVLNPSNRPQSSFNLLIFKEIWIYFFVMVWQYNFCFYIFLFLKDSIFMEQGYIVFSIVSLGLLLFSFF